MPGMLGSVPRRRLITEAHLDAPDPHSPARLGAGLRRVQWGLRSPVADELVRIRDTPAARERVARLAPVCARVETGRARVEALRRGDLAPQGGDVLGRLHGHAQRFR